MHGIPVDSTQTMTNTSVNSDELAAIDRCAERHRKAVTKLSTITLKALK